MTPTGYADLNNGALITQASLQQIGVQVNIQTLPFGQIVSAYSKPETAPMMTDLYNSPFTLDPVQFLVAWVPGNFSNSLGYYNNPKVTSMINTIATTRNAAQSTKLLHDVQHLIRDDAPCIFGGRPQTLVAHRDYITGYQMQFTDYRFPVRFAQLRIKAH
jgi:ABC-type transport system substrate-binding protein